MRLSSKMTTMMAYLTKTANYCGTANVRKLSRLDYSLITAKEEEIHIDWYLPAEKVIEIGHRQICLQKKHLLANTGYCDRDTLCECCQWTRKINTWSCLSSNSNSFN